MLEYRSRKIGVAIKFSSAPRLTKGFWQALQDLRIDRAFIMAPVARRHALAWGVDVVPVWDVW